MTQKSSGQEKAVLIFGSWLLVSNFLAAINLNADSDMASVYYGFVFLFGSLIPLIPWMAISTRVLLETEVKTKRAHQQRAMALFIGPILVAVLIPIMIVALSFSKVLGISVIYAICVVVAISNILFARQLSSK